jgi:phosphoribosyl-ATP pyrophosphohydrolase
LAKQKIKNPGEAAAVTAGDDAVPDKGRKLKRAGRAKVNFKSPGKKVPKVAGNVSPPPVRAPKTLIDRARLGRLERLEIAVEEVRRGALVSPRTSKLQTSGIPKMAQKLIEEASEVAIEAIQGNRAALINESVDLLYNLVVLLSGAEVPIEQIWAEMDRRELTLGIAEKLPKVPDPQS